MKKTFIILVVVVIILVLAVVGWQFLFKKSNEGGSCKNDKNCLEGLKCVNNICYSGKEGDPCNTYQDCQEISLCKNSKCLKISEQSNEETFNEYFTDIGLGILPPGGELPMDLHQNVEVFSRGGGQLCLYGTLTKDSSVATAIYDSAKKKYVAEKTAYPKTLEKGGFAGCSPVDMAAGKYEYKVYIGDTLVALLPFEVQ
jgi:hypothetical protein